MKQWYVEWFTKDYEFIKYLNKLSLFVNSENIKIIKEYMVYYYHTEKIYL